MGRKCSNCKHGQAANAHEREQFGRGQAFIYCLGVGPKVVAGGTTQFPTLHLTAKCSLHEYSLWKLIKSDGA